MSRVVGHRFGVNTQWRLALGELLVIHRVECGVIPHDVLRVFRYKVLFTIQVQNMNRSGGGKANDSDGMALPSLRHASTVGQSQPSEERYCGNTANFSQADSRVRLA